MLESLKSLEEASAIPRKDCEFVRIADAGAGTIVQARTESNSHYLLEVLQPSERLVQFICENPKRGRHRSGCRINPELKVGSNIRFGSSGHFSSKITSLAILEPPSPA